MLSEAGALLARLFYFSGVTCLGNINYFRNILVISEMSVLSELAALGVCMYMAGDVFEDACIPLTFAKTWLICSLNVLGTQTLISRGPYC